MQGTQVLLLNTPINDFHSEKIDFFWHEEHSRLLSKAAGSTFDAWARMRMCGPI